MDTKPSRRIRLTASFRSFMENEASGGIILMAVAALALIIANSPLSEDYFGLLKTYVGGLSILHWINDALMAVFFLLVGLEIKREMISGQLSNWSRRALPGFAALGGMVVPGADLPCLQRRGDHPRLGNPVRHRYCLFARACCRCSVRGFRYR